MDGSRNKEVMVQRGPRGRCSEEGVLMGRYKILKTLQTGEFAKVELGLRRTWVPVILKTLPKSQKLSVVEPTIMKVLDHPNIVKLLEVVETPEHYHLVLEYANGGDLASHIFKVDSMLEVEVQHIFKQLVCAVKYCHEKEIAHRDIKPENILLDRNKNVKLCDFGLSTSVRAVPTSKVFCGTIPYCAPELFSDLSSQGYDPRAVDIWSMGVVLYVMVTKNFPFKGKNYEEMKIEMRRPFYYIPPKVPVYIVSVIRKLMTVDPNQRPKIHDIIEYQWLKGSEEFSKPSNIAATWDEDILDSLDSTNHNYTGVKCGPLQDDHEQLRSSSLQERSRVSKGLSCGPLQHGHEYHLCSNLQKRDIVSCGPVLPNHDEQLLCSSLQTIKGDSNNMSCGPVQPKQDEYLLSINLQKRCRASNSICCGPALPNHEQLLCSNLQTIKGDSNSTSCGPVQPKQDEHLLSITLRKRRRAPKSVSCGPALPNHEQLLCSNLQTINRVSNSTSCGPVQHDLEQHLDSISENHITQVEAQNENPRRSSSFLQHTPPSRSSEEGLENVTITDAHQDKSLTPQETQEPNLTSAQPQRVTRAFPRLWGGWKQVKRRIVKGLRRLCCCLPAERSSHTSQRRMPPQEGGDDGVT